MTSLLSLPTSGAALLSATPQPTPPAAGDVPLRDASALPPFLQALQRTAVPALWARDADGVDGGLPAEPLPAPGPASALGLFAALEPDHRRIEDVEDLGNVADSSPDVTALAAADVAPSMPPLVPADATQAFQPHGPALLATVAALGTATPLLLTPTAQASVAAPAGFLPIQPVAALHAAASDVSPPAAAQGVDLAPKPGTAAPSATASVPESAQAAPAAVLRDTPSSASWAAPLPADIPSSPAQHVGAAPRAEGPVASALLEALGERIGWQLQRGHERALIRLDPPLQGQLEISVRRDGAGIQVQLTATHSDVARQLQAITDSLRTELAGRQAGDVTVTVAHTPREHDGRGRQQARDHTPESQTPGQALAEGEAGHAPAVFALQSHQN
jgi:flagellar hook-length control protein FliK